MARARTPIRKVKVRGRSGWLGSLFKVQPGEGSSVLLLGSAILATSAGYWLGGNSVDGLVSGRFGAAVFPYLFIIKGFFAFVAITLYTRWLVQINRTRMLIIITAATVILLLGSRLLIALNPDSWFYFLLWPLCYVVPDLFLLQAWSLAGAVFDNRQNKRLFPLITAVGAVGVVAGNFLTVPLVQSFGSSNLLVIWSILVVLAFAALYIVRKRVDQGGSKRRGLSTAEQERVEHASVWESLRVGFAVVRYYKIIGLMVISTGLTYLLYFTLFKVYVARVNDEFVLLYPNLNAVDRADILTSFYGLVGGAATAFAFVFGSLVSNRLFARFGVRNLVLAIPLTNLVAFGALLFFPGFYTVVAARFFHLFVTEALGTSVNQTIYNLLPQETREAATPFNNQGVSKQGGIVLSGFLVLLSLWSLQVALILAFGLAIVYVFVALRMRALYRPSLVQLLREGQQNFFSNEYNAVNSPNEPEAAENSSEETLRAAILGLTDNSSSEGTRRLSAELLGQMGASEAVSPLIKALMTDASGEVRRTAITALVQLQAPEALPNIAQALSDTEAPVRAEAAAALRQVMIPLRHSATHFLNQALQDRDPVVRREAALTMLSYGRKGEALTTLWEMGRAEDAPTRREAAAAYGLLNDKVLVHNLADLLDDFNPEVRRQAAASLGRVGGKLAIRTLMANIEDNDGAVRDVIAHSLAALWPDSAPVLLEYLHISSNSEGAACVLQALTLAKVEAKKQERALAWETQLNRHRGSSLTALPEPTKTGGMERRLPASVMTVEVEIAGSAGFDLSPQELRHLLNYGQLQLQYAVRMAGYLAALNALDLALQAASPPQHSRRDPANLGVVLKSLKERYDAAVLRAVGVIGLLGDVDALALVASGLQAEGRRAARMRADAIEALENFGDSQLTPRLVQLLEGRDDSLQQARRPGRTMSDILLELWKERDPWLQACVLHIIGLFELRRLRPLVAEAVMIEGQEDYLIEETGTETLKRLDGREERPELLIGLLTPADRESYAMQTLGTLSTMSRIMLLQKVPIFANLRPEDLRRVALVCKERLFAPGDVLCYEGDPGDELYVVVSGQVQILLGYGGDSSRVVAISGEGDAVGTWSILDDSPRSATLRAYNGPVRLLILGADEFKRILRERPEMAAEVIRVLSRLLRETNRRLQESSTLSDNLQVPPR